jgi:hypothetical protein
MTTILYIEDNEDNIFLFPPEGGSRTNSRAHGHPKMGAMSPLGTKPKFAGYHG